MITNSSSYLFNGSAALTELHTSSFTVAGWFKPKSTDPFVPMTLFISPAWKLTMADDGKLTFTVRDSTTGDETATTSLEAVTGGWNFFALVYFTSAGGSSISILLNGLGASTSVTSLPDSSSSGYVETFQMGDTDRGSVLNEDASFDLDSVTVWARALDFDELATFYLDGDGDTFPFAGGNIDMIFQGLLISPDDPKPVILGSSSGLFSLTRSYDGDTATFEATLGSLFTADPETLGFFWTADNFYNRIVLAQHDNRAQYWLPADTRTFDLPGLPVDDAAWDGVTVFFGHVLLWESDRLKWSDKDDFTTYIPVAETAVSAVLTLDESFVQPSPDGTVSVQVVNPVAAVRSISLSGSLAFSPVDIGETDTLLLNIINTGTADLTITGISFPDGFSGTASGVIPVGGALPVVVTFAPLVVKLYDGLAIVASDATQGTSTTLVSGEGTGDSRVIELSGVLDFGLCKIGKTLTSAVILTNTGTDSLTVAGITLPTGFTGTFSGVITAGDSEIVPVTFTPVVEITYSGDIEVASDATDGDGLISVTGRGVAILSSPTVFLTDNGTCQFGDLAVSGTDSSGVLRIYNPSSVALSVVGLTLPSGFTGSFSGTVAAYGFVDVASITFSPVAARTYGGLLYVSFALPVSGTSSISVSGTGVASGKIIELSGNLTFGGVPVNSQVQALLKIKNVGDEDLTVTSITHPDAAFTGTYAGVISPGVTKDVIISFLPDDAIDFSETLTVEADEDSGTDTFAVSGSGFELPQPSDLVADQTVLLEDKRDGVTYYNFYTVVSMDNTVLVLKLLDLTGATPAGFTLVADGRKFFTLDANEAGETRIVGAKQNGTILKVVPQGDYAYSFKERSIQSIQYTGLGSGIFFVHNEVSGEGLLAREAIISRDEGTIVFLGHSDLYMYQGGPNLLPVCRQATRELYDKLDRTRLHTIRLFHHETRKEIWVKYPVAGGFRVLIWNYVEDSATFDDYDPASEFTAISLVDWSTELVWKNMSEAVTWETMDGTVSWESLLGASIDRIPLLASRDGQLRIFGRVYSRDGEGYKCFSESMDFDFGSPDVWKYVDTVILGLQVTIPDDENRLLTIEIGQRGSLNASDADIVWTSPKQILVNGKAPITVPVKVNPGGAGRYLRVRFSSEDADVHWRVSSYSIHCRAGGMY